MLNLTLLSIRRPRRWCSAAVWRLCDVWAGRHESGNALARFSKLPALNRTGRCCTACSAIIAAVVCAHWRPGCTIFARSRLVRPGILLLNPALWRWKRRGQYTAGTTVVDEGVWGGPPTRRWRWRWMWTVFVKWVAECLLCAVITCWRHNLSYCAMRLSGLPTSVADLRFEVIFHLLV